MSARAYLSTSKGTYCETTANNEIPIGTHGTVVRVPCVQCQARTNTHMHAQVYLITPLESFVALGTLNAPHTVRSGWAQSVTGI